MTTLFFFLLISQKQWRGKKDERGKEHNVSMREKIVKKLSQNGCTDIISQKLMWPLKIFFFI